ncbi:MAG: type VI secretion system protein TssA, partial [Gammaproteobacteria bacterium]|nr:type VI secretion system protein TssA [Gammaproteobacteria bacterium]
VPVPENFDGDPPNTAAIEAAFMDADLDELIATSDAIGRSADEATALDGLLRGYMDVSSTPDLQPLIDMLNHARRAMVGPLERRGVGVEAVEGEEEGGEGGAAAQNRISGEITSREDVVRTLEKICEYYQRTEPASPVPLLLRRAQRVATMDFLEIIRNLTPSGVSEAEWFIGPAEE